MSLSLDPGTMELARSLDGLPLALTTLRTYLKQTSDSCIDYLHLYHSNRDKLYQSSRGLLDYDDRTLYSTWNMSYQPIQGQDPSAAELSRLMAYLDNQDLWYELSQAGADADAEPSWRSEIIKSKARFNNAMSKLHDYSLVEVQLKSYSLHACVHDSSLEFLNRSFEINCIGWPSAVLDRAYNGRLKQGIGYVTVDCCNTSSDLNILMLNTRSTGVI